MATPRSLWDLSHGGHRIQLFPLDEAHKTEVLHLMLQLKELGRAFILQFDWSDETWIKRRSMGSELEMPDLPWFNVEEWMQWLREIEMLDRFVI